MNDTSRTRTTNPALSVYFDGECPVCRREIAAYQKLPGADGIAWVDAAQCDGAALGDGLNRATALGRMHVRGADGQLLSGAAAFAAIWLALPGFRWLGRIAATAPAQALLEPAYGAFLRLRRLWRAAPSVLAANGEHRLPADVVADLRTDHAGETGAVWIYRGIAAITRREDLREFAVRHGRTEQQHLDDISAWLPASEQSLLLPIWKLAGWTTGAIPALFGATAVYQTIAAVESFVETHYADQIERLEREPELAVLRELLIACREEELHHRDESASSAHQLGGGQAGLLLRAWTAVVGSGSAIAVRISRRI